MTDPVVFKQTSQPHPRILIRNRVKELLIANVDVAERVYCSRPKAVFLTELPVILIYIPSEDSAHESSAPRNYVRKLTLNVEILHALESDRPNALDDYLDSRAFEIENSLLQDRFIGLQGLVEDCEMTGTENVNMAVDGDMDIASSRVVFQITYRTNSFYQGTLDEFLRYQSDIETTDGAVIEDHTTIREE